MNTPQGKTIASILEQMHEHGMRCYCEDQEKGLTLEQALTQIEALVNKEVIGEDVPTLGLVTYYDNIKKDELIREERNIFRAEQREALTKITRKDK